MHWGRKESGNRMLMAGLRAWSPLVTLLAVWTLAAVLLVPGSLPSPVSAVRTLFQTAVADNVIRAQGGGDGGYLPHVWSTCWHVCYGAVLGVLFGGLVSLAAARSSVCRVAFATFLKLLGGLPQLIFVPFVAVVLGPSDTVQVVCVSIFACLTMCPYVLTAVKQVDADYVELGRLLGASQIRSIFLVQIPGILPTLLGPIRLTFAYGIGISVVVEYLVAPSGIGRVMKLGVAYTNVALVFTGVMWAIILAFIFDGLILLIFRPFLRWTERRELIEWLAR